jgi:hypothetical protein
LFFEPVNVDHKAAPVPVIVPLILGARAADLERLVQAIDLGIGTDSGRWVKVGL